MKTTKLYIVVECRYDPKRIPLDELPVNVATYLDMAVCGGESENDAYFLSDPTVYPSLDDLPKR